MSFTKPSLINLGKYLFALLVAVGIVYRENPLLEELDPEVDHYLIQPTGVIIFYYITKYCCLDIPFKKYQG
jgi:hypothetical protein